MAENLIITLISSFQFFIFLFIGAVIFFIARYHKNKLDNLYGTIAQGTGLQYIKARFLSSPMINGNYRNHAVIVRTTYEGHGKNRTRYFTIEIQSKVDKVPRFTITEENFFHKIGKKIGFKEANVGNPQFDNRFYISGSDDEYNLRSKITPSVQQIILNFKSGFKLEFSNLGITYKVRSNPDAQSAVKIIQDIIQIAEQMER